MIPESFEIIVFKIVNAEVDIVFFLVTVLEYHFFNLPVAIEVLQVFFLDRIPAGRECESKYEEHEKPHYSLNIL